jgi:hypothetical protein
MDPHTPSHTPPTPSDKPRCFTCNRKLNLVEQSAGICKCKQVFCAKHRCVRKTPAEAEQNRCHPCGFDYLQEQKQLLTEQNPVIKFEKLRFI